MTPGVAKSLTRSDDSVSAARADIDDYLASYNAQRPHSSVDRLTPDEAFFASLPQLKLAA